ncbi:hypothetical protein H7A76_20160 [Pseudomonas sp. MSSRFD41]|uniref:pyocin knob domain-containing protein n=1 Tax=Pseudomonas sp. MSSRFD41 TaxID=1310370 RepID=UPI00163A2620|nr:pyocin knob domain-containing protein [Pseudomonas sp. MSSRFD41]MBC2657759.1 hypothetical protein [Pseudomonas sp. MSSRFD41]
MTLKTIKAGAQPNDGTGDNLRSGAQIINENFAELDNRTSDAASQINTINNKLSTVEAGATKNRPDAELLARASHTGTQLAATISNFSPAVKAILQGNGLADYVKEIPEVQLNGLLANSFVYVTPDGTGAIPFQTSTFYVIHMTHPNTAYAVQIAVSAGQGKQYSRFKAGGTWSQWNSNLTAGDYGVGAWALQAPAGNTIDARVPTGLYGFAPAYGGAPSPIASGEYINLQGSVDAKRATQLAFSHDTDEMWFRRDTNGWGGWKPVVMERTALFRNKGGSAGTFTDLNTLITRHAVWADNTTLNIPRAGDWYVEVLGLDDGSSIGNYCMQRATSLAPDALIFVRTRVAGTWSAWVRQTPEFIANANGFAIKYADGTMICWFAAPTKDVTNRALGAIFASDQRSFTFPIQFVVEPIVVWSAGSSSNGVCWGSCDWSSVSQTNGRLNSSYSTIDGYLRYIAIGRWK